MPFGLIGRSFARLAAGAGGALLALSGAAASAPAQLAVAQPATTDYVYVSGGTTPPTQDQCAAVGRTCFSPQAIQSAYDVGPLYERGLDGTGKTIAIFDSFGSDTMAHDLHVFDQAFGIRAMCGEESVTCATGMPRFSELTLQGSPATVAQPSQSMGTGLENHGGSWAVETALDVETSHAIAPGANILLVHTPTAETFGVQGFPQIMAAEDYVVKHHLADVISQSFGAAEQTFGGTASLQNLRYAFKDAAAAGVSVLASSGDNGTANVTKQSFLGQGGAGAGPNQVIPFPTVNWPTSDPLVTSVGGTYLCTDPNATTDQPRTNYQVAGVGGKCGSQAFNPGGSRAEVAWTFSGGGFSSVFPRPTYQAGSNLPAGSSFTGTTRGVPDVAFQASSGTGALIYVSLPNWGSGSNVDSTTAGWYDIGGTSLSCPQWAGLIAIADQLNGSDLGFLNNALYKLGATPSRYAADFYDVNSGNTNQNPSNPTIPGYPASNGWDAVTGLGTPNAANLVPDLVAAANGH